MPSPRGSLETTFAFRRTSESTGSGAVKRTFSTP